MTRNEYMYRLEKSLHNCPECLRKDIRESFYRHYEDGLDAGMSIAETLGYALSYLADSKPATDGSNWKGR